MSKRRWGIVCVIGSCAVPSLAGTIRHDVPTIQYAERSLAYPAVGLVDGDGGTGSGTLIAPQWLLTAGHVSGGVWDYDLQLFVESSVIYWLPGYNALDGFYEGEVYMTDQWFGIPGWTGELPHGNDIGLIHLRPKTSEEIDFYGGTALPTMQPMRRYVADPPANPNNDPLLGRVGTTAGYGLTGTGITGFDITNPWAYWDLYRRAGDTTIDLLGGSLPDLVAEFNGDVDIANQFYVGDFDDPQTQAGWTHNTTNRMGGDEALPYEYSVAPADSGGPLLIDHDNNPATAPQIAGVNSWIEGPDGTDNATYDDIFGFASLNAIWDQELGLTFNDWISSVVNTPGDADSNFVVDITDLAALAANYGMTTGGHWHLGDFNGNGTVDIADLGALAGNYSAGSAQAFADFEMLTGVPEPSSLSLLGAGAVMLLRRRHLHT